MITKPTVLILGVGASNGWSGDPLLSTMMQISQVVAGQLKMDK